MTTIDAIVAESLLPLLATATNELRASIERKLPGWIDARSPAMFRAMELDVAETARGFADQVVEVVLREMVADSALHTEACAAAKAGASVDLRDAGRRTVDVTLLSGRSVKVRVPYLKPDRRGRPGRPRGTGRRGEGGVGVYPLLAALGIWFGVTPAVADEISRQVTDSDSIRTGRAALARRGLDLGHKQTLRIVNATGQRAVQQRDLWVKNALEQPPSNAGVLRGKRIVVAIDGGRIRQRVELPGRPDAETGHHRYDAPWCEPKLFCIYVVDKHGNIEDTFRPIYDGTMENCHGAFERLAGYLKALGAHEAKALVFLGDGAKWIWDAMDTLTERVGIPKKRVTQVVDWYHAVEVLGEVADARADWPEGERQAWLKKAKKALHAGNIQGLMLLFDDLARGRRAKEVNKHRDYFVGNAHRMQYAAFKAAEIPIGSGYIESAIRRVVNMRMKGNGIFWLPENAEAMLLLRSYLKAGRFDDLIDWSLTTAASWWRSDWGTLGAPIQEVA